MRCPAHRGVWARGRHGGVSIGSVSVVDRKHGNPKCAEEAHKARHLVHRLAVNEFNPMLIEAIAWAMTRPEDRERSALGRPLHEYDDRGIKTVHQGCAG